jgi:hypothetical protein
MPVQIAYLPAFTQNILDGLLEVCDALGNRGTFEEVPDSRPFRRYKAMQSVVAFAGVSASDRQVKARIVQAYAPPPIHPHDETDGKIPARQLCFKECRDKTTSVLDLNPFFVDIEFLEFRSENIRVP